MRINVIIFLFSIFLSKVQAQNAVSLYNNNAYTTYQNTIGNNRAIFSGKEYVHFLGKLEGHIFWNVDSFVTGSLGFNGNIYNNVLLKLDILHDELVLQGSNETVQILVDFNKIDSFTLNNDVFLNVKADSLNRKFKTGFYQSLYSNKVLLLSKRIKQIREELSNREVEKKIIERSEFFVKENGIYYSINSKQELYNFFKLKKTAVLDYMNGFDFSYKKQPELFIITAIKYYDQLTN